MGRTVVSDPTLGGAYLPINGRDPGAVSRRGWGAIVGAFLALIVVGSLSVISLPYVVLSPGPISDTLGENGDGKELIQVAGAKTYPTEGSLDFTTVRILGGPASRVTLWDVARAWVDSSSTVQPVELYFPEGVTERQVERENTAEMTGSQQQAIAVALRGLGQDVKEQITITGVATKAPAKDDLMAGDRIVSVDGVPATDTNVVQQTVRAHQPGESVDLALLRDGEKVDVSAKTTDSEGNAALGIGLGVAYDFPYAVTVDAGNVGGPSAGLMFTLGIYDTLTPGALTGGNKIAGTGTIDGAGTVGPIGGIQQKLAGAQRGGATWFLAPADNCAEVVGHIPDGLSVTRVTNFDEARTAVEAIAKGDTDSLPVCTP